MVRQAHHERNSSSPRILISRRTRPQRLPACLPSHRQAARQAGLGGEISQFFSRHRDPEFAEGSRKLTLLPRSPTNRQPGLSLRPQVSPGPMIVFHNIDNLTVMVLRDWRYCFLVEH